MKAIHFKTDNTTALLYLVKMGETKNNYFGKTFRNLEVSPTPWHHNYCWIYSKQYECGLRLVVKKLKRPFRVETPFTSISENLSDQRKTKDGPFSFSIASPNSTVHCMETRS